MTIEIDHIRFSYGLTPVIRDLSLSFDNGHFYSIIGPNGSGKTTLLDLLSGFLKPASGRITLNGHPISSFSAKAQSRQISIVSQDTSIKFPFTVEEVVLMGRHPYVPRFSHPAQTDIDKAFAVMDQCGIAHLGNRRVIDLSGGERQRCMFARALCQDTPVLLLDEAFSNLDIRHTLQLLKQVKASVRNEKKLVISVFHDLNLASVWSDALVLIKDGRVMATGDPKKILTQETIKAVFDVNAVVEFNPHTQARQVYYPAT